MGSLKTLAEDHHCHDILLESPILTDRGQWLADPNSNSNFGPDLSSESDATAAAAAAATRDGQTPQGTQDSEATMATDQPAFPSGSSKASGEDSTSPSPSLSSCEEADLSRSELLHEAESCQLDPVPACLNAAASGADNMRRSHVSVNSAKRHDQLGGEGKGDNEGGVTMGQRDQWGEEGRGGVGGEKSCPPIRRDVSQEITILVTSHDNCVEDEQGELQEEEKEEEDEVGEEEAERGGEIERARSPNSIREEELRAESQDVVDTEGSGGALEGCIVVASLTSTSEVERPQIVGSNSLETGRDSVSDAQCEEAKANSGSQVSSDPINSRGSGCLPKARTEAQQSTGANSPLNCNLSADGGSPGTEKPIHTQSKSVVTGNATEHKEMGQMSNTNESCASESKERLQKAKTLDLSSGRFSASSSKTVQGQSSLEVVTSHSVATSPMTPPEGSAAFLFPYSTATAGAGHASTMEIKEFKSVATAPMSPQNLTAPAAIPEAHSTGVEMRSVATAPMTPQNLTAPVAIPEIHTAGVEMRSVATAPMTPQNLTAPVAIPEIHTAGVEMRSVATAPMTPQNLTAPVAIPEIHTAGVEMRSVATAPMTPQNLTAPVGIPEAHSTGVEMRSVATAPMSPQNLTAPVGIPEAHIAGVELRSVATAPMSPQNITAPAAIPEIHTAGVEMRSVATAPMTPQNLTAPVGIPEAHSTGVEMRSVATAPMSPQNLTAPVAIPDTRKVGSVQTQMSLEVMCHSVATSPMTPSGGSTAFFFPHTQKVELRSVATAPMSPQGLTAPEAIPEALVAGEDEEPTSPEIIPEPRVLEPSAGSPEPPEPLQDVSWDEKGMTWDVYGAVVEVAVLGTAIQKHLEKQVRKHRKQTSSDAVPSPTQSQSQSLTQEPSPSEAQIPSDGASSPPASDLALDLAPDPAPPAPAPAPDPAPDPGPDPASTGSQKRRNPKEEKNDSTKRKGWRRNPLRGRFRRLHLPSCCSRSRPEEAP
ncbi:flocculation protein FLO11 [Alosa alosa]|uniref:flocculation protein FLO11 n=1 Tax=Alosa alosa TaxID=278164 RepID=UPI0020150A2B|nr:flocculation protein FLO11 [Alosa alosa]